MGTQLKRVIIVFLLALEVQYSYTRCNVDCKCMKRGLLTYIKCENKQRTYSYPLENLPNNTYRLDLKDYHHLKIPYHFFHSLKLQMLEIINADLHYLFELPKTLEYLHLETNQLNYSTFAFLASQNLSLLQFLELPANRIVVPQINKPLFKGLPSLRKIILNGNTIPHVSHTMFQSLHLLQRLRMADCRIKSIHPRAFEDLKELWELDLSYNPLKHLPHKLFQFQGKLLSISLANEQLTTFPILTGPKFMQFIDLSYNDFSDWKSLMLSNVTIVLALSLQANKLDRFPKELLSTKIVRLSLDLSFNYITTVDEGILGRSNGVNIINLGNNRIEHLNNGIFQGLRILERLYLNGNKIHAIQDGTFRDLRLSKLFLHNNSLTALHRPFAGVKRLSVVTLYDNNIRHFSKTMLRDLPNGTLLYISCDNVEAFHADVSSRLFLYCVSATKLEFSYVDYSTAVALQHSGYECDLRGDIIDFFMAMQTCRGCKPGHFNKGKQNCHPCPKGGFYQDQTAQTQCKKCNNGQYVDHDGGTSPYDCQICPFGTNPNLFADTRACYCLPGHARRDRFGRCNECTEEGVTCFNGTKHLAPGYWWKWHSIDDAKKYICFQQNLQVNGEGYDVDCNTFHKPLPKIYRCPFKAACLGGMQATCHTNYTGPLCAACSPGYYPTMLGCLSCPSKFIIVLQILTIGFLMLICILVLCYTSQIWLPRKLHQPERTLSDAIASVTKIVLTYYQLLAVIVRLLYDLQWPKLIVQISSVLYHYALLLFSIPSLKCIHPSLQFNAYDEMILVVAIVLFLPILLFLIKRLHFYLAMRYRQLSDPDMQKDKLAKAYWTSLLVIYFVLYPGICQRIFQIMPFNCRKICLDRAAHICNSYLRVDFTARCPESQPGNWVFVYIGYAALIIPPLFPACLLLLMWKGKREQETQTQFSQQTSLAAAITRFCYENYKAKYWYWEILELSRKLLFAVGFAFFGLESKTNLGYLIVISGLCTVVYAYVKPIQHKYEHYLQLFSLSGLFLNLCLCVLLNTSSRREDFRKPFESERKSLTIIFLVTNAFPVFIVLASSGRSLFIWCLKGPSSPARVDKISLG